MLGFCGCVIQLLDKSLRSSKISKMHSWAGWTFTIGSSQQRFCPIDGLHIRPWVGDYWGWKCVVLLLFNQCELQQVSQT